MLHSETTPRRKTRAVGNLAVLDAVRIAIGEKVFSSKCELKIQFSSKEPYLLLSFAKRDSAKIQEHLIPLKSETLTEVKYFIATKDNDDYDSEIDDSMTFSRLKRTVSMYSVTRTIKKAKKKSTAESTCRWNVGILISFR